MLDFVKKSALVKRVGQGWGSDPSPHSVKYLTFSCHVETTILLTKILDHVKVADRGRLTLAVFLFCETIMNLCSAAQTCAQGTQMLSSRFANPAI